MVLLQPVDDVPEARVLAPQPGEERGVLVTVVRSQRRAHGVAAQHQVVGQVAHDGRTACRRVEPVPGVVEHLPDAVVQPSQLCPQRPSATGRTRRAVTSDVLTDRHPTTVGGSRHPGNP